jgi:type 1 fimbria pilin
VNRKTLALLAFAAICATPASAPATTIDASLIPDGTYTVKVEKVLDSKHLLVTMDNGAETTLAAGRPTVDFSKVKPNDQLKLSLIKGNVMVFADLSG